LDPKARGDLGKSLGVDLRDDELTTTRAGELRELGRERLTRSTPRGPEVDEYRDRRVLHQLVEVDTAPHRDRVVERQERTLARGALRAVSDAGRGNSIELRTRGTLDQHEDSEFAGTDSKSRRIERLACADQLTVQPLPPGQAGSVPVKHGPSGLEPAGKTIDFNLQNTVERNYHTSRIKLQGNEKLTDYVLREAALQFSRDFKKLPDFGGSLAFDNKAAFQRAYAAISTSEEGKHMTREEIATKAVLETRYGDARKNAHYDVVAHPSEETEIIVAGDPPREVEVPKRVTAHASPSPESMAYFQGQGSQVDSTQTDQKELK